MAEIRRDVLRRMPNARPHPENIRPQGDRINPLYQAGRHRQLQEPWITLNVNWDRERLDLLIRSSAKLERLLQSPIIREVHFAENFHGSRQLTFDRLNAAVIQSRGTIVNDPGCYRCRNEEQQVFPECVSKPGTGNNACAADMWHRKGSSCAYNRMTGMTSDPVQTRRSRAVITANTEILAIVRARYGQATAPVEHNQQGRLQERETLIHLRERRRNEARASHADERRRDERDRSRTRASSPDRYDRRGRDRSHTRNRSRSSSPDRRGHDRNRGRYRSRGRGYGRDDIRRDRSRDYRRHRRDP